MKSICLYFQVHQPYRLRNYRFFDIGHDHHYYDDFMNRDILSRVAENSYLPMNNLLMELIGKYGDAFKVAFSISGSAMDQFESYAPEVLDSFKTLANTGQVEFLAETYNHSLSSLRNKDEFFRQVQRHRDRVKELFGQDPKTFRNAELLYSDGIGEMVSELGFTSILSEGAKHILGWKSPNFLYVNAINPKLKVLLRNFNLSDDISFRFAERGWSEWPLTAGKFASWLNDIDDDQEIVNIFVDYETFGEHLKAETGIFDFMRNLPVEVLAQTEFRFRTPQEVSQVLQPVGAIHAPYPVSWADEERDITAWLGNELQNQAVDSLYDLYSKVMHCEDEKLKRDWDRLQASDHFHYMSTKWFSAGEVHKQFNPYPGAYEAFINYMNVLADFEQRLDHVEVPKAESTEPVAKESKAKAKPAKKSTRSKKSSPAKLKMTDILEQDEKFVEKLLKKSGTKTWRIVLANATKPVQEKLLSGMSDKQVADYKKVESKLKKSSPEDKAQARRKFVADMNSLVA